MSRANGEGAVAAPALTVRGHRVGRVTGVTGVVGAGVDADVRQLVVDYPGNPHGPLPARDTLSLDAGGARRAADAGAEALLVFDEERSDRPIVVGLLSPLGAPAAAAEDAAPVEVLVDGERIVHTAARELVLRCGEASVQLLSDGTVRVRGTNVLSRASATNRIRGGNVQIN